MTNNQYGGAQEEKPAHNLLLVKQAVDENGLEDRTAFWLYGRLNKRARAYLTCSERKHNGPEKTP
jgi:hypothetical protein